MTTQDPNSAHEFIPPSTFRWPGGKRIAVMPKVAFEGWSEGRTPGIGPMGNPLKAGVFDTNAHGWAEYGPRRGIDRVLRILERHDVKSSVLVNGVIAERYPEMVKRIAQEGHEIVGHSYAMDIIPVYLTEEEERENIQRTADLIEKACGVRTVSWISPRATPSLNTTRILAELGYKWHGDFLNEDLPYVKRYAAGDMVAMPTSMEVNDLPLHIRYGNPPRAMLEIFEDTLAYLTHHKDEVEKQDISIHAHVFGRPAGAWVFERMIEISKAHPDVWLCTRGEAADHVLDAMAKA